MRLSADRKLHNYRFAIVLHSQNSHPVTLRQFSLNSVDAIFSRLRDFQQPGFACTRADTRAYRIYSR